MNHTNNESQSNQIIASPFAQTFFHGTRADLKIGDFIAPGFQCNFADMRLRHVYVAATLNAAMWGAELAQGSGRERIYLVEATGEVENDPNVTDKKFPGNPTMSYRSIHPFKVIGEVNIWNRHSEDQLKAMKDGMEKLLQQGVNHIID